MSDVEWLGEVPIYRYDPKASAVEDKVPWDRAEKIEWLVDGEVVAYATLGPVVHVGDGEMVRSVGEVILLTPANEGDE